MSAILDSPLDAPQRHRWRAVRWTAALVIVAAIGVGAVFGSRLGADPALVDSPLIGQPAPTQRLPYLEGEGALSLADLRGRVTVVNFWASWCLACRAEHPALLVAASAYRDKGVVFVGVNHQDKRSSAVGFLDELGRGDSGCYRYVTDPGSTLALDFGVFGLPETFFLDERGTIVAKITGESDFAVLAGTLDSILAGQRPGARTVGPVQPSPGGS